MQRTLPVHPSLRHPLTGEPLVAIWVRPDGRVMWPVMGASPDDPAAGDDPKPDDKPADAPKPDPKPNDLGYPPNTPVAEMKADEREAYWKHQAKKHETRNAELLKLTGGKYGDDLKAELDALEKFRRDSMTDAEKALEDARKSAREQGINEAGIKNVKTAFDLLMDMPEKELAEQLDVLDLSKFLKEDGSVDTAKVRKQAAILAPSDKGKGPQPHDYGAGRRGGQGGKPGSSGLSEADRRFGKPAGA